MNKVLTRMSWSNRQPVGTRQIKTMKCSVILPENYVLFLSNSGKFRTLLILIKSTVDKKNCSAKQILQNKLTKANGHFLFDQFYGQGKVSQGYFDFFFLMGD